MQYRSSRGDSQCLRSNLAACQVHVRFLGPSICKANMDARSLQNGCEFLCFVCRGGVSPPVLHKFVGWGDPSPTGIKCRTTLKSVGATIGRPRAIRESPLHQKQQTPYKPVGAGVPDCPCKTQYYFYKWREDNILPYKRILGQQSNP